MGSDWPILAQELNVPDKDIDRISDDVSDPDKRGLEMLQLWVKQAGIMATGIWSESNSHSTFQSINHSIYIIYRLNGLSNNPIDTTIPIDNQAYLKNGNRQYMVIVGYYLLHVLTALFHFVMISNLSLKAH